MPTDPSSPYEQAQRELAAWRATHPDASLYEMEPAVEVQIKRLRVELLGTQSDGTFTEERPGCPH